ncbi:DUF2523 family protein [Methylophaga sp.]|uniref:DUF2523 family protein n=1 Tax=Methylophaga sp. TaxID=2024840 RepID=UPI0027232E72|nr:DUF2523 family protein [Methylophaga sp.]MDO8827481.1 DUF2523 family protein [Methylophaga sp.]
MKGLAKLLFGMVDLAPGRVLAALGMGFISFGAITAILNALVSQAQNSWNSLAGVALQIASLAGIPEALGIVFGASIARAAIEFLPKLGKLA